MPSPSHNPDDRRDLGEVLRPAVEQIRRAVVPRDAVHRSVDRALHIVTSPTPRRWPGRRTFVLLVGAMAASVLLAVLSQVASFTSLGFFARMEEDRSPPNRDSLLVRATTSPTHPALPPLGHVSGGRVAVQGGQGDRYQSIGMNELSSNWGDWERVQSPAQMTGQMTEERPDDLRVEATWSPQEANVRLHLTDPEGKRLPVAEIESGPPEQPRRSQYCVIAQASQGVYVLEVSLPDGEKPPPGGITIRVQITLQGGSSEPQVHKRIIRLEKRGERIPVARVGF